MYVIAYEKVVCFTKVKVTGTFHGFYYFFDCLTNDCYDPPWRKNSHKEWNMKCVDVNQVNNVNIVF